MERRVHRGSEQPLKVRAADGLGLELIHHDEEPELQVEVAVRARGVETEPRTLVEEDVSFELPKSVRRLTVVQ